MRKFLIIALLLIPNVALSQGNKYSVTNKKAIERYTTALTLYDKYDLDHAENYLLESIEREPKFIEAYLVLAQIYSEKNEIAKAIEASEKAATINADLFPQVFYSLGHLYLKTGEYQKSKMNFEHYLEKYQPSNPKFKLNAQRGIEQCSFALHAVANPVPFEPQSIDSGINTRFDEYWPSLSADERTIVYTARCPKELGIGIAQSRWQEDFFVSRRSADSIWGQGRPLGEPINTDYNEGAQALSSDGQKMFYTVCRGQCDIYFTEIDAEGYWKHPVRMSNSINTPRYNEKQPTISPDGRTLYFVSNRPGGKGGYDIWYSTRSEHGEWQPAVNLGDTINTSGDEQSPFIHFDNQTLYFSSDGHMGMGGQDIFISRRDSTGKWGIPQNLGYPINTHRNEEGFIVNARGTTAYYATDIVREQGLDIYTFEIPANIQPIPTSYFTGIVKNSKTKQPICATVSLIDLSQKTELMNTTTSNNGSFLICLPTSRKYGLFASAPSYLFHSQHFDFNGIYPATEPYRVEVLLHPIEKDEVIIMRNILFATDSYELEPESTVELDKIASILEQNPSINIEIGGHTDNQGESTYNQKLSENRAKSVAQYIVGSGIAKGRVKWTGYGESKPVATNETAEGRATNRRTELRIL